MTVEEFRRREEVLLALIHDKLKLVSYRFKPARRVLILKRRDIQEEEARDTGSNGSDCRREYA